MDARQKQCEKLQDLFDYDVEKLSFNTAVEFYDGTTRHYLTYKHVNSHALLIQQFVRYHVLNPSHLNAKNRHLWSISEETSCSTLTIALYVSESCFIPSLVVGLLKAGVSFLPLNPVSPKSVVAKLLHATQVNYIITSEDLQNTVCGDFGYSNADLSISFTLTDGDSKEHTFLLLGNSQVHAPEKQDDLIPLDLAYVLSTSGTTGDPKLVYVPHKCILSNIIHLRKLYEIASSDKVAMCSPLTFDPSIVELFITLSAGATLVLVSNAVKYRPAVLAKTLFKIAEVTVMQCTPTLIYRFSPGDLKEIFSCHSSLRVVVFGGESCPTSNQIKSWISSDWLSSSHKKSHLRIFNIYGITEVSSWSTIYELSTNEILSGCDSPISLGYPLLDTVLEIVDEKGEVMCQISSTLTYGALNSNTKSVKLLVYNRKKWLVTTSQACTTGYLWVGGQNRVCYVKDGSSDVNCNSSKTRNTGDLVKINIKHDNFNKLFDNTFAEERDIHYDLCYIGRTDGQVKRHGKRMNVLTIKCKLDEMPMVSAAHVVNFKINKDVVNRSFKSNQNSKILAFIMLQNGQKAATKQSILKRLETILDAHYIPDDVIILDQFPMTNHGKIDEKSLLKYVQNSNVHSSTVVEEKLQFIVAKHWIKALNVTFDEDEGTIDSFIADHSNSNFIDNGGDSFSAVKLVSTLQKELSARSCSFDESALFQLILNGNLQQVLEFIAELDVPASYVSHTSSKAIFVGSVLPETSSCNASKRQHEPQILQREENETLLPAINCTSFRRGNMILRHGLAQTVDNQSTLSKKTCFASSLQKNAKKPSFRMRKRWRFDSKKCIDASPLVVLPFDETQKRFAIIGSHSFLLASVDIKSGLLNWQTRLGGRIESSACLSPCGRYVIVGCYDNYVYVLECSNGSIFWKFETGDQVKCSPCPGPPNSSLVFIGSHDGNLYCLDAQNRSMKWSYSGCRGAVFSSPLYHQSANKKSMNVVFSCTLSGLVCCLAAADGSERWTTELRKPIFSSMALCSAGVCVGCVDHCIYMMNEFTGKILWKFETSEPIFSSPSVFHFQHIGQWREVVSCGSHDGRTYCLNSMDGFKLWEYPGSNLSTLSPVYAAPFATTIALNNEVYDIVVTASTNGTVSLINIHDGHCLAQIQLPGHVFSSPIVIGLENDYDIFVGCRDDFLYCLSIDWD